MRPHYQEIVRWVQYDNGVGVWQKIPSNDKWHLIQHPDWRESDKYIVDDEWADLRKAQADGEQLQYNNETRGWIDVNLSNTGYYCVIDWRIKPDQSDTLESVLRRKIDEIQDKIEMQETQTENDKIILRDLKNRLQN